ncbi:glycosyltransferase [Acetobacter tropicalis]|uniref:Glycosyl transferase n=1 Tax=Acetobacter tropicalis TaxID=104102 RepID=A0A094YLA5_9PROT|nr:glycosyltransferase [Acetobacter tropicalis]KAA8389054.1 glycosyltransferase [Acetobacter tropicalis]KAA8391784.1 glycosyltransferase [Acetobacter tropicalis]KGB22127.1 hypothetical protein AtDm6_2625 [Acetobacter tropicalis]MBC9009097.1 glycosyltransferase [Acetobacter tropicalis]MDO8171275.1 glycosyltransferase [Acetobacter tropicalis]
MTLLQNMLFWQDETLTREQRATVASAQAQDSFRRGNAAWESGQKEAAWDWLERANRQAADNPHVMFALALARHAVGDAPGAILLLEALLKQFDFREGWLLLTTFRQADGDRAGALQALAKLLSSFAATPESRKLAASVCRLNGVALWGFLDRNGLLKLEGQTVPDQPEFWLDGVSVQARKTQGGWSFPQGWQRAQVLDVQCADAPNVLGSPFSIKDFFQCAGAVAAGDGGLEGWCWHPYNADYAPDLTLRDPQTDESLLQVNAEAFSRSVSSDQPLARYRRIFVPWEKLPEGPVRVVGSAGQDLAGSPLDARLEWRSAHQTAQMVNGVLPPSFCKSRSRKTLQSPSLFIPLPVADTVIARPESGSGRKPLAIIIPVFRNHAVTLACLQAVRGTVAGKKICVVVVDDASPEPDLAEAVEAFARQHRFEWVRHEKNRGFPAAVNTGLQKAAGCDVIVLNSDTLVAKGWVEELRHIAYAAADTGTVTPFSNDASILSYPSPERKNVVPDEEETQNLMVAAHAANAGQAVEIPTANGFCMYVRHDCLIQTGLLREDVFAQGYGEENDFCMRARALGWKHMAAPGAFVAHVGSASFGEARAALMQRNAAILERLHPGYHAFIAGWMAQNPLFDARRRLDLVRFRAQSAGKGSKPKAVVLVTHAHGGGVERVVQQQAATVHKKGARGLVLRPTENGCVLEDAAAPEYAWPSLRFRLPEEWTVLTRLLRAEGVSLVAFHHLEGHAPQMYGLAAALGCPHTVHVHDYMWFCQRISLLGPQGTYCGEPDVAGCQRCVALAGRNITEECDIPVYLARSERLLKSARAVYAPSRDTAKRMMRHFPTVRCQVKALEKADALLPRSSAVARSVKKQPALPPVGSGVLGSPAQQGARRLRLCLIGGIGWEKGYGVLHQAALDAAMRDLPLEFVIVGHTPDDATLMKTGRVFITGEYREEDAVSLIASVQAQAAFLPSIWPETWCFTLSLAWKAGLPAIVFDLGAPAERVRASGRGKVINPALSGAALNDILIKMDFTE